LQIIIRIFAKICNLAREKVKNSILKKIIEKSTKAIALATTATKKNSA